MTKSLSIRKPVCKTIACSLTALCLSVTLSIPLNAAEGRAFTVTHGSSKTPGVFPASPAPVGSPASIKFTSVAQANGKQVISIDWGDGSAVEMVTVTDHPGAAFLLTGTHTYASGGVFNISATFQTATMPVTVIAPIVVGQNVSFNAFNGASVTTTRGGNGAITLNLNISTIPGAVSAQTIFISSSSGGLRSEGDARTFNFIGTTVSTTVTSPDVYVAETLVLDAGNNTLDILRTTIPISAEDLGASAPISHPVAFSSMKGKFAFSSSRADKVDFTGAIVLPPDYIPKSLNDIIIAIGNVADKVQLDAKGKLLKSTKGYLTKLKITPSKTSGTPSKISFTMNTGDLDTKGFESDGIRKTLSTTRPDNGSRLIQIGLLINSQSYSVNAPVAYRVSSSASGDFGTLQGRSK